MDALSNLNSIRADVIEVWDAESLRYKTIQETIVGLPPSTLNSIELLAGAIGNDPGFFTAVAAGLSHVDSQISTVTAAVALKVSSLELASQMATVNVALDSKAASSDVVEELALVDTALALKGKLIGASFSNLHCQHCPGQQGGVD